MSRDIVVTSGQDLSATMHQLLMCNDDSKCHHTRWCASDPRPRRLPRKGFRTASQLLEK